MVQVMRLKAQGDGTWPNSETGVDHHRDIDQQWNGCWGCDTFRSSLCRGPLCGGVLSLSGPTV